MPRNTSVTLGEHFDQFVADKIKQGRFQSASEVIRAGLRRLEEDETKLQALKDKLQNAEKSPIIEDFNPDVFLNKMHQKYAK